MDATMRAISEIGLVCIDDVDARVVAGHVAPRNHVQVWDQDRFVGLVQSPYAPPPPPEPAEPAAIEPENIAAPIVPATPVLPSVATPPRYELRPPLAAPAPVADAVPTPAPPPKPEAEPEPEPVVWDDGTRPFNPFRRGAWRRRART
jgi:hypothetical protein